MSEVMNEEKFTNVQQFGVHLSKNGTSYKIWTGYYDGKLCASYSPKVCIIDPEFSYINAIMWQALETRQTRAYFDSYATPPPTTYD